MISRSISSKSIYELWGVGTGFEDLHEDVRQRSKPLWAQYQQQSFRFAFDTFQGTLSLPQQTHIVNTFRYLDLRGPIRLRDAEQTFTVFVEFSAAEKPAPPVTRRVFFGRFIASSSRHVLEKYTLKKRSYINTTSMDAELALLTANISLARANTLFYDPFVGTGSFIVACAHFGAYTLGSDIDGRMLRGKQGRSIATNFQQYDLESLHLDDVIADLTNSPLRLPSSIPSSTTGVNCERYLDGIICDPPYGVREGLKVLGRVKDQGSLAPATNDNVPSVDSDEHIVDTITDAITRASITGKGKKIHLINNLPAYLAPDYIPPKRPYSLTAMLHDILDFATRTLVDNGRVSLWMPTANDEAGELAIPKYAGLELVSMCTQEFGKWSRRLLTYRRLPGINLGPQNGDSAGVMKRGPGEKGRTADELNTFRRKYFQGFRGDGGKGKEGDSGPSLAQ